MRTPDRMTPEEAALTRRTIDAGKDNGEALKIEELTDPEWITLRSLLIQADLMVEEGGYIQPTNSVRGLIAAGWLPKPEPRPVEEIDLEAMHPGLYDTQGVITDEIDLELEGRRP
ncbi:hypothetical protein [Sphingomonas sp. ACRSK]|uniref:hypothetical protein n=1 Tax=Sphingomonas sp. ACRSK TaxID=2918213 RepID=UPI001EF70B68|nr:hypothetical protein [Sphingomonas sp. ACRSK]MCG7348834.1 hypothetical protein [Sphingomonas sp. ACRSK]